MRNLSGSTTTASSSTTTLTSSEDQGHPRAFRATVAGVLLLEIALGLGSNLTVLAFYAQRRSHLVNSVSIFVTVNLHVIDALLCAVCAPLSVASLLWEVDRDDCGGDGDGWGWTIDGEPPRSSAVARGSQLAVAHEACVAFAGVSTAANMLAISLDRYDIAVRPAKRFMTRARSAGALAIVWLLSAVAFLTPFLESNLSPAADFAAGGHVASASNATTSNRQQQQSHHDRNEREQQLHQRQEDQNAPLHHQQHQHQLPMMMAGCHWLRYHLALQIPICGGTAVAMLVFYSRLVRALRIRVVPSRMARPDSRGRNSSGNNNNNHHHRRRCHHHHRRSRHNSIGISGLALARNGTPRGANVATNEHPPSRVACAARREGARGGSGGGGAGGGGAGGVGASVSVILTLHRAIKRYRQRRKNQRRLFRMSLVIVSTFALCWLPLTLLNAAALWMGPDPRGGSSRVALARPRAACLAAAYAGPVLHPLLYAFSRQKVRRALAARGVGVGLVVGLGLGAVRRRVEALRAEDASVGRPLVETQLVVAPQPRAQLQPGLSADP
ncbi:G-protein coupled receptor 22-like [Petromyzon marinus]|uniref:G-protein coupled receptor 22-like n=1 Tax=Petromyzon marinus TaxID=7757 RepID=UPI003F6F5A64